MAEETPIEPIPGDGPPQTVPPAAGITPIPGGVSGSGGAPASQANSQERTFAMLTHLTAFVALLGIPFGNIFGPLVVWLVKREQFAFVDQQGKESLNFQISMTIYLIAAGILSFLLIGIPFLIALAIAWVVLVIVASVKANGGEPYRYPLTIRFIN